MLNNRDFRALPKRHFTMKIITLPHFIFFLDKKNEAKKIKAVFLFSIRYDFYVKSQVKIKESSMIDSFQSLIYGDWRLITQNIRCTSLFRKALITDILFLPSFTFLK